LAGVPAWIRLLLMVVAITAVLGGCGGDEDKAAAQTAPAADRTATVASPPFVCACQRA